MAVHSIRSIAELEIGIILAAERYDPRRASIMSGTQLRNAVTLESIVDVSRTIINAKSCLTEETIVLDTSNAQEGILINRKPATPSSAIGSAKKVIEPRDVIISRLRPYLRQVAYVDHQLPYWTKNKGIACSSEFFVLRSRNEQSIAFLVPFLLSDPVQQILAASQEGGHHPRFNEETLLSLNIPEKLIEIRNTTSLRVEDAIHEFRKSESAISAAVDSAKEAMNRDLVS